VIGECVGPYRIVELLGQGGASEVYRAYHQETAQDVALKILRTAPDERTRTRFQREAEALKLLEHPGIIRLLGFGEYQRRPYYTMPFVRVLSLQDVFRQRFEVDRGRFSQDEVLRVLTDVARALRFAHAKGITHRDVKPGNILIDPEFRPVLCDFGLARLAGADTVTRQGTMLGTPRYMPPEQLQGRPTDHRSDLYALGMVGYEMATGQIPFDGGEPLAAAVRRLTEAIPPLASRAPHLDQALADLIMAMLAREPGQRPANAGEVVRALEGFPGAPPPLAGADLEDATREERAPISIEEVVANPLPMALAAGLAACVLVALPAYLWLGHSGPEVRVTCRLVPYAARAEVHLEADHPVMAGVRYGRPGALSAYASPGEAAREHKLRLEGLEPGQDHAFALVFEGPDGTPYPQPTQRFRTAPSGEDPAR